MVNYESCADAVLAFAIITMVIQVFAWVCAFLDRFNIPEKAMLPCLFFQRVFLHFFNIQGRNGS